MQTFTPILFGREGHKNQANTSGLRELWGGSFAYAVFSKENHQSTSFSACRAYCCDALIYQENGRNFASMGHSIDNAPIDTNNLRVGVYCPNVPQEKIVNVVDFLRNLEKDFRFETKTSLYYDDKTKIYLFVADKLWMHSSIMLSFYMLLIRNVYDSHKLGNTWEQTLRETITNLNRHDKYSFLRDLAVAERQIAAIQRMVDYGVDNVFFKNRADNFPEELIANVHSFGANAFLLREVGDMGRAHREIQENFFREIPEEEKLPKAEEYKPEIKLNSDNPAINAIWKVAQKI